MIMIMFDATLEDHSHNNDDALAWADGVCLNETESSEVPASVRTDHWTRIGSVDSGCIVVWHDGISSYLFEAWEDI